jgi:hypothetical protein
LSDLTVANDVREEQVYQVLPAGEATVAWTIPANKVVPTVKGCPFESIVMYETRDGWKELKDNEYVTLNTDASTMTVDLKVSAERYLELVNAFGSGASGYIDESIQINVQVISKDTNGNELTDDFYIIIEGSDQDYSSVCNWEILSLQDLMADNWLYEIGDPDEDPVYMPIPVTTWLDGVNQLSDECQNQIYMSLDVQIYEGVWFELWSSKQKTSEVAGYTDNKIDEYMQTPGTDMNDYMNTASGYMDSASGSYNNYMPTDGSYMPTDGSYMPTDGTYMPDKYDESMSTSIDMPTDVSYYDPSMYETRFYDYVHNLEPVTIVEEEGGFMSMVIQMSDSFYRETVQFELGNTANTVDAEFRLAFKNSYGEPVTYTTTDGSGNEVVHEMADEFVVKIIGNDDFQNSCADVTAELDESARSEYNFGFNSTTTYQERKFNVDKSLKAKLSDPNADCAIKYKLSVWDVATQTYKLWDDNFVKDLENIKGGHLSSEVKFNTDDGSLEARFSNFDVQDLAA